MRAVVASLREPHRRTEEGEGENDFAFSAADAGNPLAGPGLGEFLNDNSAHATGVRAVTAWKAGVRERRYIIEITLQG